MCELWNIFFPDLLDGIADAVAFFHVLDGVNEQPCPFIMWNIPLGYTCGNGEGMKFFMNAFSVRIQHIREKYCIGITVRNIIGSFQGMSHSVDVSHVGFGKGAAGIIGRL